jgi:Arc/MetJ-type ribon-helix-helix transcriptional regulator
VQRKGKLINVWLNEQQKTKLDWLAERTHVSRSELVRQALELLFDKAEGGQLSLGFRFFESEH